MTFNKPNNLTFTQIAQWIDSKEQFTFEEESTLCQYLYYLFSVNIQKLKYFQTSEQIEDFSMYCTSRLLLRYRSCSESKHIKSVTNYIKNVLPLWKADYIREYCYSCDSDVEDFDVIDYGDYLLDVSSEDDYFKFDCGHTNVSVALKKYLSRIPVKRNSTEWQNIYISCLLTLQDRLRCADRMSNVEELEENTQKLSCVVRSLRCNPPILFHIDETMSNYVSTLVNELVHVISLEVSYSLHSNVTPSSCFKNLVAAAKTDEDD